MNMDDFEQQLRKQPIRPVPAAWRKEILSAARAEAEKNRITGFIVFWAALREWLWPAPQAWAGLAVVWVAVLCLQFAPVSGPGSTETARVKIPAEAELALVLEEQRRLRAELLDETPKAATSTMTPRPRSQQVTTNLSA